MRTTISQFAPHILHDLIRGIYSLQTLLLIKNLENRRYYQRFVRIHRDPDELLGEYARTNWSRLSISHMKPNEYAKQVSRNGNAIDFATFMNEPTKYYPNALIGAAGFSDRQTSLIRIQEILNKADRYTFHRSAFAETLKTAAKSGHLAVVELLIPRCSNVKPAIVAAIREGHFEIVRYCISIRFPTKSEYYSYLNQAAEYDRRKIVEYVLCNCDTHGVRLDLGLAIDAAITNGNIELTEFLYRRHPTPFGQANKRHLLEKIAENGHHKMLKYLLYGNKAPPRCGGTESFRLALAGSVK